MMELHKIPSLVNHYFHHLNEDTASAELSFVDFLEMHYGDSSAHRNEENHEDLPLFHACCATVFFVAEEVIDMVYGETNHKRTFFPLYAIDYSYSAGKGIFQPPRLA